MANASGAPLGQARGIVTIEAQFQQAEQQLTQFSVRVEQQFTQINRSTQQATSGFNALATVGRTLGGVFGVSLGVGLVRQLGDVAIESTKVATSYERQMVAAQNLAGSQAKLNELMEAYDAATGGAIDKATSLQNVTKLMAVGFGDDAKELEQFATVIRGISLALGSSQEFVTQNLILEMFSQRGQRLDQLGLQYDDIRRRAEELQRADASLTDQMAYQNAVLEQAQQRFGALAESSKGAATGLETLDKTIADARLELGLLVGPGVDFTARLLAGWVKAQIDELKELIDWIQKARNELQDLVEWANGQRLDPVVFSGGGTAGGEGGGGGGGGFGGPEAGEIDIVTERTEAISDYWTELEEINRQEAQDLNEASRSYAQQRARTIADYEESIAQSAADFAKNRMRAEEDYQRSLERIQRDAYQRDLRMAEDHARNIAQMQTQSAARLADLQADLDRSIGQKRADSTEKLAELAEDLEKDIADKREDSLKRLADLEEDYQKQREQAAWAHEDKLRSATARLDAVAIYEEQRRYEREKQLAAEGHQEKVDDEQEKLDEAIANLNQAYNDKVADEKAALEKSIQQANDAHNRQVQNEQKALNQRIDDANKAYEQQLSDAKAADAQRLLDMEADFTLRKQREDADQLERLGRMATHHQQELTQMDTEHSTRLSQISTHAEQDRTRLDEEFAATMTKLGDHFEAYEKAQDLHLQRMMKAYEIFTLEQQRLTNNLRIEALKKEAAGSTSLPQAIELGKQVANWEAYNQDLAKRIGQAKTDLAALAPPAGQGDVGAANITTGDINIHLGDVGDRTDAELSSIVETAMLDALNKVAKLNTPGY